MIITNLTTHLKQTAATRDDIVEKARSLLGLRFRFYGRSRERGVDCVGVVLIVGWELGLLPEDCTIPRYPFPVTPEVFSAFDECMDERGEPAEGRVVVWAVNGQPRHVGILTMSEDRWRCIGIDWARTRQFVTSYAPTGLSAWKYYDYRGVE